MSRFESPDISLSDWALGKRPLASAEGANAVIPVNAAKNANDRFVSRATMLTWYPIELSMTNIELNRCSVDNVHLARDESWRTSSKRHTLRMPHVTSILRVAFLAIFAGCGGGDDDTSRPACLSGLNVDSCDLAFPAQFDLIFDRILKPSCASAGVSCHGSSGGQGGLVFTDKADAYDRLLAPKPGGARVKPGDAACSEIVVRLDSIGNSWSMPPMNPLDERERCTIR